MVLAAASARAYFVFCFFSSDSLFASNINLLINLLLISKKEKMDMQKPKIILKD
jgi:hypothetical protein